MRALLLGLVASLLPAVASAQGHPTPPRNRALHERLAEADAVALVEVLQVEVGRIRVKALDVLAGTLPESFLVKRSPARPPPLLSGNRALFFLRGSRAPYVLVDLPREVIVVDKEADLLVWTEAVRDLAAGVDPAVFYVRLLDGDHEGLRQMAVVTLVDPRNGLLPYTEGVIRGRVAAALDPAGSPEVRRISATMASTSEAGARSLVEELLAAAEPEPPEVWNVGVRGVVGHRLEDARTLLLRVLGHMDPAVRRIGAAGVIFVSEGNEQLLARLAALADTDPDQEVRREAARVLELIERRRGGG